MSSITLSDAKRWFEETTLPLNPGLVAIAGKARAAVRRLTYWIATFTACSSPYMRGCA
jgi:hypothetical protein